MTPNNVVSWIPEISFFRTPFWTEWVNGYKTLLKCASRWFYANFLWISHISRMERSLLVRSEILGLCFNTLTGDNMHFHLIGEIFPQLVRTQLCQKPKTFSRNFIVFFKSTWNFEHFQKKMSFIAQAWHRRMSFLQCPKGPASEHLFKVNELTSPKHCWNVQVAVFILVLH